MFGRRARFAAGVQGHDVSRKSVRIVRDRTGTGFDPRRPRLALVRVRGTGGAFGRTALALDPDFRQEFGGVRKVEVAGHGGVGKEGRQVFGGGVEVAGQRFPKSRAQTRDPDHAHGPQQSERSRRGVGRCAGPRGGSVARLEPGLHVAEGFGVVGAVAELRQGLAETGAACGEGRRIETEFRGEVLGHAHVLAH